MYRMHPDFELPERDSIIWRDLTLDKFTDLLESQEVFFARADVLQDQREGVWSVAEMHDLLESRGACESQFGEIIGMTERISAEVCKTVALNCWCIGEDVHAQHVAELLGADPRIGFSNRIPRPWDALIGASGTGTWKEVTEWRLRRQ